MTSETKSKSKAEKSVKELIDDLLLDPSADFTEEELIAMKDSLNPHVVSGSDKSYINISIMNWREQYIRKFTLTALVGFLFRLAKEYDSKDKAAVLTFLNAAFEYDPEKHIRMAKVGTGKEYSVSGGDKLDPELSCREQVIEKIKSARAERKSLLKKGETKVGMLEKTKDCAQTLMNSCAEVIKSTKHILKQSPKDLENTWEDSRGILLKNLAALEEKQTFLEGFVGAVTADETLEAYESTIPVDVFYNFERYVTNHYLELRKATEVLYAEKPDIEYSLIYYDTFKTPEDARAHRIQHQKEFKADVVTVENGGIVMCGSFKENIDRADFYSKNLEVFNNMFKQGTEDMKLGKELMEKQVKGKKVKNILKEGPSAPAMSEYREITGAGSGMKSIVDEKTIAEAEAKYLKSQADAKELAKVSGSSSGEVSTNKFEGSSKLSELIPDDAVQVDYFVSTRDVDGNEKLEKRTFFTEADKEPKK